MSYKAPVNYRSVPTRVGSPEAFTVEGGFAQLREAPADPTSYGTIVNIAGNVRNRVDVAPSAGQYRILTQTVTGSDLLPHLEYLPVLQFHSSDEGLSGTADYYGTGTILTSQFFAMLLAFLTPLVGVANTGNLPAATMSTTERGRPGDLAFLADGSGYFSDGSSWLPFASGATPGSSFSLGQIMAMALDSGYVGPSFTDDVVLGTATFGATLDGTWAAALSWTGDTTIAQIVGMTSDANAAEVASVSVGQTLGMSYDAILALVGAPADYAATFGATLDGTWAAGSTPLDVSDNFNRADGALGSNWTLLTGAYFIPNYPQVGANKVWPSGSVPRRAAAFWSADTFAANQYAEIKVVGTAQESFMMTGCAVRLGATQGYVAGGIQYDDGYGTTQNIIRLYKWDGTTLSQLAENTSAPMNEVVIKITASGNTISVFSATTHGGTYTQRISVTNTSHPSGGAAGIWFGDGSIVNPQYGDDWYGGNL